MQSSEAQYQPQPVHIRIANGTEEMRGILMDLLQELTEVDTKVWVYNDPTTDAFKITMSPYDKKDAERYPELYMELEEVLNEFIALYFEGLLVEKEDINGNIPAPTDE